ncbi:MAG TPA: OmpA family protein [Thermoanaerobaculia bacterium]|nr:OmpA family protein [Thermoanaerobaculia bacterium]
MIRKLAVSGLILLVSACATDPNMRAKRGAAVGAAAGAVAGAIVGNQSGNPETGAVVGAAAGAAIGGTVGHRMDQQQRELQQIQGVEVNRTANDELNVVLKNDVLFDTGSYALRSESRSTLSEMGRVFNRYSDSTITVEGHTDSVGSDDMNQTLSERRASSVRSYLVNEGVPSSRIIAHGYGETQPKASNNTPEGRQLNRRVEIHVKANQG